jgi:hypothetical protein
MTEGEAHPQPESVTMFLGMYKAENRESIMKKFTITGFAILLIGCNLLSGPSREIPDEYKHIFKLPLRDQVEAVEKLPVEEQFHILIYGTVYRHPPFYGYSSAIAKGGEEKIPYLIKQLRRESYPEFDCSADIVKARLILIFADMPLDLSSNEEVISAVKSAISTIEDPHWKSRSKNYLAYILKGDQVRS